MRLVTKFPVVPMAYGRLREAFSRHPLPPGDLIHLESRERANQRFLLERFERLGPVFKATSGRRLQVCIVGIPRCRQFLKEHGDSVTPVTVKLESLFPKGFLRKMHGEDHRHYRRALVRAIDPDAVAAHRASLEETIVEGLARHAAAHREDAGPPAAYMRTLDAIASALLIHLFFGAPFRSGHFAALMAGYQKLGPDGFEWWVGRRQRQPFAEIRDLLLELADQPGEATEHALQDCILRRMSRDGLLDATSLGQLIYMVEMGRFDLASLFRWLSFYAAEQPAIMADIAADAAPAPPGAMPLAEAFVLETLRLNQSERLMRVVNRDVVFGGYLIPRHASVRLCMWESHKSSEAFSNPFVFDPGRFLTGRVTRDQYSPFGLDQHNCPLADMSITLSELFVRTLAAHYAVEGVGQGPAVRGRYHWQPPKTFTVRLNPR